jgi:hypothetical protein
MTVIVGAALLSHRNINHTITSRNPANAAGFFGNRPQFDQSEARGRACKTFACQFEANTSLLRRSGNLRTWEDLE